MNGFVRGGRRHVGGLLLGYRRLPCGRGNQLSGPSKCCCFGGTSGEQAIMTDAAKAFGQDVQHESTNELVGCERHGLIAVGAFDAVVFVSEGDALVVCADQAAV